MIRSLSRFALHITLMGILAACGGGGTGSSSGGNNGGNGGNNPPVVTLSSIAVATTSGSSASVAAGLSLQFKATGTYSDGTTKDLSSTATWNSGDTAKALVTSAGLVTGVAAGSTTITAASAGVSGNVALTVAPPNLVSVVLSPNKPTVAAHKVLQFSAIATYTDNTTTDVTSSVTFSSSNPAVASVGNPDTSKVTANTLGTASINGMMTGANIDSVAITVTAQVFAYATNYDSNSVSQYKIDSDGSLSPLSTPTVETDQHPFSISVEPSGEYVYVSNWGSSTVSQFRIGDDGMLSKIGSGSVPTGVGPNAVTIDPANKHAYVANLGENTISQYNIGLDGQLSQMATAKVGAGSNPGIVVISPDGKFAYAGNFGANSNIPASGPSTISQYSVNPDGSLKAMSGASATAASGSGPISIAIDSTVQHLYVANLGDNNIGQYNINSDGTLLAMTTATVPSGPQPVGVAIDPTGKYVYVANQGDGTLSQYTVSPTDGSLTAMTPATVSAGGAGTSSVTIDPTGQYVYATNRTDTTIAQFKIDTGNGGKLVALTSPTVSAGTHPAAIATGY